MSLKYFTIRLGANDYKASRNIFETNGFLLNAVLLSR